MASCGALGPIGVGLALRSFVDFGLSLTLALLVSAVSGFESPWVGAFVGAAWVLARVLYDNHEGTTPQEPPTPCTVPSLT
jgi:hypothetical protein